MCAEKGNLARGSFALMRWHMVEVTGANFVPKRGAQVPEKRV